jgi:hypothetical protein
MQGVDAVAVLSESACAGGITLIAARQLRDEEASLGDSELADSDLGDSDLAEGKGLLHDAQNLLGAVGLYCDLLSAPGVLKAEHLHYAEDLRLVGTRSSALMERLVFSSLDPEWPGNLGEDEPSDRRSSSPPAVAARPGKPATLRRIVDRCSGLLGQVAGGRAIEVSYGAAASIPVRVDEETVERILFNLVLNAAAALEVSPAFGDSLASPARHGIESVTVRESLDGTEDETPGAIRIGVGLLVNRVGDPQPWPFRRVRLTIEDSGCGMTAEHLERVLHTGGPSRGGHGMGLRVVRELVASSEGELRAMSAPGIGTRVQIEWPAAPVSSWEGTEMHSSRWLSVKVRGREALPLPDSSRVQSRRKISAVVGLKAAAVLQPEANIGSRTGRSEISPAVAGRRMPC